MSSTAYQRAVISIHALREEGDSVPTADGTAQRNFYPRPPRGGRLVPFGLPVLCCSISIHALREEGDRSYIFQHFY